MKTKTSFYLTVPEKYLLKKYELTKEELNVQKEEILFNLSVELEMDYFDNIPEDVKTCDEDGYKVQFILGFETNPDLLLNGLLKFSEKEEWYEFIITKSTMDLIDEDEDEDEYDENEVEKINVKAGKIITEDNYKEKCISILDQISEGEITECTLKEISKILDKCKKNN